MCPPRMIVLVLSAVLVLSGAVRADFFVNGVLTADVELTVPALNDGEAFPVVINPDYHGWLPVNESGWLTGPLAEPSMFAFSELPVYAIVPYDPELVVPPPAPEDFVPWDYASPLFNGGGTQVADRLFSLAPVGRLSLDLTDLGGGQYGISAGTYFDDVGFAEWDLSGGVAFGVPPWGNEYGFAWYGVDSIALTSGADVQINGSNDGMWQSGWPGITLDKNFFPIPEPATLSLLALGGLALLRGRRVRRGLL